MVNIYLIFVLCYFLLNIYDVLHTKAIEMIEYILYIKLQ